jgi:hypothetical protein
MKRREFIGIAAVGAAGVVLPSPCLADGTVASILSRPRLIEILKDERAVQDLGESYRRVAANEDNAPVLTAAILHDLHAVPLAPLLGTSGGLALRGRVDELVHHDFSIGRTVILQGWILSLTEARQCALFSLQPA